MYAVIEQGGKQHKVSQGDVINIELTQVAADAKTIKLGKVLFVNDGKKIKIGTPYLDKVRVIASFKTVQKMRSLRGRSYIRRIFAGVKTAAEG